MTPRTPRLLFILTLFLIALITGTYYNQVPILRLVHHALMGGLVVTGLLWLARSGGLPRHPLTGPILGALAVWGIAAALALDPRVSIEHAWFPIGHALLALVFIALIQRGRGLLLVETQFMLAAVVGLFAVVHLASWYFGLGLVPDTTVGWIDAAALAPIPIILPQVYMPLGVSTWLAAYCAPLIVLALAYGAAGRGPVRSAFWTLAALLTVGLLATGSRGGLIALAGGLAVYAGVSVLIGAARIRRGWAIALGTGALAALAAVILLIGRNPERFTGDALRLNLWRGAVDIAFTDPLTGVGVGMFGRAYREVREPYGVHDNRLGTAHNAYLNSAAETGLIGVVVMAAGAAAIAYSVRRRWTSFDAGQVGARAARLRWIGAVGALAGFAVQSAFDTFTAPPLALMTITLIALATAEPRSAAQPDAPVAPKSNRPRALIASGLAIGMGLFTAAMIVSDAAYLDFRRASDEAAVEAVIARDPGLALYRLQAADLQPSEIAYAEALALAPTWDIGWINRAALAEFRRDYDAALEYLDRARRIDRFNGATVHWGRIAEFHNLADDETIISAYRLYFDEFRMPFSPFWWETPLRREALERLIAQWLTDRTDLAYRLLREHAPDRLPDIVAAATGRDPAARTAGDWWVIGQDALTSGDAAAALNAFDAAIGLDRRNGDYAAGRARARIALNPADPLIAADIALVDLLITRYENANAVRALIAPDEATRRALLATAVPGLTLDQNFEGVVFAGRVVGFEPVESMRQPGLGRAALQPWIDLEASYLEARDYEAAEGVRAAIERRLR